MTDASPGALWRDADPEVFRATIVQAAEQLDVQPLAVEKDYWVCEALRAIDHHHPGRVVFKGGTSLEKLRLIQRFSEDLDLLVVGEFPSANAAKTELKRMLASAQAATVGAVTDEVSGGNLGTFHRQGYLSPPLEHPSVDGAIADTTAILVELGQSGGPNPSDRCDINSLLARQLRAAGFDVDSWADLQTFGVEVLHPGRTLLEKMLRVNNFAADPDAAGAHGWPRIGRQFYDIYALLGDDKVRSLLANRPQVAAILASANEISERIGRPDRPAPAGGFAASPAFDPDWEFASRLREEHDKAMEGLYYGNDQAPSFDEVLDRVHESADLLQVPEAGTASAASVVVKPVGGGPSRGKTSPASTRTSFRTREHPESGVTLDPNADGDST